MTITELHPPTNGGTLFQGMAVTDRGRRYIFNADRRGETCGVFREDPRGGFVQIGRGPAALKLAVRKAVRP